MNNKRYIKFVVFFALAQVLLSCNMDPERADEVRDTFAEADSLSLMNDLIAEMRDELMTMYDQQPINPVEPDPVCVLQYRPTLTIKVNALGEIMIGYRIDRSIPEEVEEFFSVNRMQNDPTNNFPMYSRISREEIQRQLELAQEEARKLEETPVGKSLAYQNQLNELIIRSWENKLEALETIGVAELSEVHTQAHVRLEYRDDSLRSQVLDSILLGFYRLREFVAQRYFEESYLEIYFRMRESENQAYRDKYDAICTLQPLKIIDVPYCEKLGIHKYAYADIDVPVPPPLPAPPPIDSRPYPIEDSYPYPEEPNLELSIPLAPEDSIDD